MRQTLTAAVGGSIRGAQLPDGSPAYAIGVDNPSGVWLQVYPGGQYVQPSTQGVVLVFPGGAESVDLTALPTAVIDGIASALTGAAVTLTLFSEDEAPTQDNVSGSQPVTVTGTANVNVTGTASVNVANTPAVTISGTPAVNVANTPTVNIGGTVTANISAGTVDIQNVANGIIQAGGGLDSLGSQNCGTTPTTVTVTITSLVRAIVIVSPPVVIGGQEWNIKVNSHSFGPSFPTLQETVRGNTVHVAYANAVFDTQWDITIYNVNPGVAGTQNYAQFYADTALPITDIVRSGQQTMAQSIPVVPSSDLPIGSVGQQTMANSLPVVIASDQGVGSETVLFVSGNYNSTLNGPGTNNPYCRGILVMVNMVAVGSGSFTMLLQGASSAAGVFFTILQGAAITTNGMFTYRLYPGLTAVANQTANDVLPSLFRIVMFANNGNVVNMSVGYHLLV